MNNRKISHFVVSTSLLAIAMAGATQATTLNSDVTTTVDGALSLSMDKALFFGIGTMNASSKTTENATLVVPANGNAATNTPDNAATITLSVQPSRGVVKLENALANQAISVSATDAIMSAVAPGESKTMSIDTYTFAYSTGSAKTDASGNVDIYVGATLTTYDTGDSPATGKAVAYAAGQYQATVPVSVTY